MSNDTKIDLRGMTLQVDAVEAGGESATSTPSEIDAAVAIIEAIPTADQSDGVTVWNDGGVLKVSSPA